MGHKKRNIAPRSKPSQPKSPAAKDATTRTSDAAYGGASNVENPSNPASMLLKKSDSESNNSTNANPSSSYASVKIEGERALAVLRRGNYTKALRMMKDLCLKYENIALAHRVYGIVCKHVASIIDDPNAKQRHLKNAIESAKKAVSLSPLSIEFSYNYAKLLYMTSNEVKEYEEVVRECERGLAIENPVDPAKESLKEENRQDISTPEARIAHIQNELRSLIKKSDIRSISTWKKNLGKGDENFPFIPIKRVLEDPMELRLVQEGMINENKKATKTPEEHRKEIEVRVTAARLLQQNVDNSNSRKGLDYGPGSTKRVGERRKSEKARKTASSDEMRDWVLSYWNSMSSDKKKDLLRIKISDLKEHFSSSNEVLNEALSFGEVNKAWEFWICCHCNEKFANGHSFCDHVVRKHLWSLSPELESVLPLQVETEWSEMILNCPWKPLDLNAAIRILHKQSKPDEILLHENWPWLDDPERVNLLEGISAIFQALIKHKLLAQSHLSTVLHVAMFVLQDLAFGSQLLNSNLDQTPLCICFLGAPVLKTILTYLHGISQSCGLSIHSDKSYVTEDSNTSVQGVDIMEKILFSQDASHLVLDEKSLPCKINHLSCNGSVEGNSGAATSYHISYENGVTLDSVALLSWIFTRPSSAEQLASWIRLRDNKAHKSLEISQLLKKEFCRLQELCERKYEHLSYVEALQAVDDLSLEGVNKRKHATVLRKRQEELIQNDNQINIVSQKFELDAITRVLKQAESLSVNLELAEDDYRKNGYLHQMDPCIEFALKLLKDQAATKMSKIDARLLQICTGSQKLVAQLSSASSLDFQTILIPLVKSLLREHLKDLAEEDATEKADTAREAFLAELALDSVKDVGAGVDSSKHVHERTKDKKKFKDNRQSKDPKITNGDESPDQATEKLLLPCAHDEKSAGSETDFPGLLDDALRLHEEEYKRRMELEADVRKLEETLEYQRRVENEAKQKIEMVAISDVYLRHNDDDEDAIEQWTNRKKDESDNLLEGVAESTATGATIKPDLSNGGVPPDGGLFSDRLLGRRARRRKVPMKLSNGKYQSLASNKEDSEAGQPRFWQNLLSDEENGAKTLRQPQAEEEDKERFQSDLKKSVLQSLDEFPALQKLPVLSTSAMPRRELQETTGSCISRDGGITGVNKTNRYGTGLKNDIGEYNCFLNVIIQSLWHLGRFRDEFLQRSSSEHIHVGDPCIVCALYDIFTALSTSSTDNQGEAIALTSSRVALSNLYPDSNFFQECQMNDASEVLGVILNCLHLSFTPTPVVSCKGSWDCTNGSCITHSIFGMNIFENMNCYNCDLKSRFLKYTSFFHNVNASALRTMKVMCPEYSFDELLSVLDMNHKLACDPEARGCGNLNYIDHFLSTPPHVFTTVLGWQNTCESVQDITATLAALTTDIDISVVYRGLDPQNKHRLVSMVCYYGKHYHCFAYSREPEEWIMYDDKTVKVIGRWTDVLTMCERGHLQPQVLFFEALN